DGQPAIGLPAPRAAPVLELDDLPGRLGDEGLDGVLVGQVVAAPDGVERVEVGAVVFAEGCASAAFGGDGVTAHRVDLGYEGDAQPVRDLGRSDGRPQAGGPTPHDDDVVRDRFHAASPSRIRGLFTGS